MGKTITEIWLPISQHPNQLSLVQSSTTLFSLASLTNTHSYTQSTQEISLYKKDADNISEQWDLSENESLGLLHALVSSKTLRNTNLVKSAFLAVFDNTIFQLSILTSPDVSKTRRIKRKDLFYKTLSARYGLDIKPSYGDIILGEEYTDLHKIQREVKNVVHLFTEIRAELAACSDMVELDDFLEHYQNIKEDEESLMVELVQKQEMFESLKKSNRPTKVQTLKHFETLNKTLNDVYTEMKDEMQLSNTSIAFVKSWEAARYEQNSLVLRGKEGQLQSMIKGMEEKMELEDICHDNIAAYLSEVKDDLSDETARWMEQYDKEYDEIEMKVYKIKNDTERLSDRKDMLQKKYDLMIEQMDDWKEYKRLKKAEMDRKIAATKIQAWWRGVMVRKKLGPYRKKKGDKKNKKGKKGKNKKK